jgi:hypothetical protein
MTYTVDKGYLQASVNRFIYVPENHFFYCEIETERFNAVQINLILLTIINKLTTIVIHKLKSCKLCV